MAETEQALSGPDFRDGIPVADLGEEIPLLGHADGEPVVIVRRGDRVFAMAATCSHYGGPLAEGLVVGDTLRCPWHHACFSLATGEAIAAPALNPLARWEVRIENSTVILGRKLEPEWPKRRPSRTPPVSPPSVAIVGAGGGGAAAAEELRKQGYAGPVALIDLDADAPYDRPNLSKDYLAGNAPEEWIPLHPPSFYDDLGVERVAGRVVSIDPAGHRLTLEDGSSRDWGALVLAPGADPMQLPFGSDGRPTVRYLRTLGDSRLLIAAARSSARAVVIGASFIGLEVAAAFRARRIEVHVVAPEALPLERVLGSDLGGFVKRLHESRGVRFHLGQSVGAVANGRVVLSGGTSIEADMVVAGIGVRPRVELAEQAGLAIDKGIVVDRYLRAAPDLYVVGDAARYPDPVTGRPTRVEHWVHAERMGQAAARNVLGMERPFTDVPFFWSAHYDVTISYVGHAETWDRVELNGDPGAGDCAVRYFAGERLLALSTISRDRESLETEAELEALALT